MVSMVNKMIRILAIIILLPSLAWGTPSISGVSGTVNHGSPMVISGSGFGTKSPAAPLVWDDCESAANGDIPSGSPNLYSQVGYSQWKPNLTNALWDMQYITFPNAPVSAAVSAPHSFSTMGLRGGHEDNGNLGRDVQVTVSTPSGFQARWYANWKSRVNPEWPTCGATLPNHKISVFQAGTQSYSNAPYANQYFYFDYQIMPCHHLSYLCMKAHDGPRDETWPTNGSVTTSIPDTSPPWDYNYDPEYPDARTTVNEYSEWIMTEEIVDEVSGNLYVYINNKLAWGGEGNPYFFSGSGSYDASFAGIRSFTVGGYYRYTQIDGTSYQHDDAFRFYDDIYVDSTLSRVMLGNSASYSSCTVLEPQIPSAWADGEITVRLNQGALPDGNAYLFVFDADGVANGTGTEVTFGTIETDETAPTVEISTTNPSSITADELTLTWTATDNVAVTEMRYRVGAQPTPSTGTAATSPVQVTGFSIGTNTLYVGARDAAGNWGYASIVVVYTEPAPESTGAVITLSGSGATITPRASAGALFQLLP